MAVLDPATFTTDAGPAPTPTPSNGVLAGAPFPVQNSPQFAPRPANTTPAPDVSTSGTSPMLPISPTANVAQPPSPSRETFSEGFSRQANPQYRATGTGEIERAEGARKPTPRSILGGILSGAISGMRDAMTAQVEPGSVGAGAGFSAGAKAARDAALATDQRARAAAQRNFENQQTVLMNKVAINKQLAETANIVQNMNHEAELFPSIKRAQELGLEETELKIRGGIDELNQQSLKMMDTLMQLGLPFDLFTEHGPQMTAKVPAWVSGASIPFHNGQTGDSNGVGSISTYDAANRVLDKPVTYVTYGTVDPRTGQEVRDKNGNPVLDIDPKTGQPVPHEHILTPGINPQTKRPYTAYDYLQKYFDGRHELYTHLQTLHDYMTQQEQQAALAKTKAETGKEEAEAGLERAQTEQLRRQAANIAAPDATGFSSPLAVAEYNKRYDKFTGSKEFQNLQQMSGSYQQFQDTLSDINAGKNMTGAQSVVGLFNAIGISAEPLAGKGFRINSNTIQEHIGARGLDQAAYQKLLALKNGDIITPQQLRDYADIASRVYENAYVNEAAEAHRQGLPADFLPQGGGRKLDPITARIFTRVVAQTSPSLAQNPAQLKQAVVTAAQKNGWSF